MKLVRRPFGRTREGEAVEAFELAAGELRATVLSYGGTLQALAAPDRSGRPADVTLGYDSVAAYERSRAHLGGIVGRYANRIGGARFVLDGAVHALRPNEGRNLLHGGARGFDRRVFRGEPIEEPGSVGVALSLESEDGDEGFPGRLACRVTYRLSGPRELAVAFEARADRATPLSLTQHAYWNLAGPAGGDVSSHEVWIDAERYAPVDAEHLPTGELRPVAGTPFDFRARRPLGRGLDLARPELARFGGYDHPFELRGGEGALRLVASARDPASGRTLEILTTAPCLQLYGGQYLPDEPGKAGSRHGPRRGLCLEAQRFPDAPNQPAFPPAILRPGDVHRQETRYRFGTA